MNHPPNHVHTLRQVLGSLRAEGPAVLSLLGQRATPPVLTPDQGATPGVSDALQQLLYTHAYTRPFGEHQKPTDSSAEPDMAWIGRLVEANTSQDRWDSGWQVQAVLPNGAVLARKGRNQRLLPPGQFASQQSYGETLAPGAMVSAYAASGSFTLQHGFYYIFGEQLPDARQDMYPLRLYANVTVESAEAWIRAATAALNRYRVPFRLKVLTAPEQMNRTDGLVVFIHRSYLHITASLLAESREGLNPGSPLFSWPLCAGLSLAEDPGNGESFGMHRCRLVSNAIWSAYDGRRVSVERSLQAIRATFEAHGIDWHRPHLNPGSTLEREIPRLEPRSEDLAA